MKITQHHSENGKVYTELEFGDGSSTFMTEERYTELVNWLRQVDKRQAEYDAMLVEEVRRED